MFQRRNLSQVLDRSRNKVSKLIRQAILRRRLPFFQRLLREDKAWALYVMVIEKYIKTCKDRKMATNYAKVSEEQKKILEHLDVEVATLEWMIQVPARTIKQVLVEEHRQVEGELVEEVKADVEAELKEA